MLKANETIESIKTVIPVREDYPHDFIDIIVETVRKGKAWETEAYEEHYDAWHTPSRWNTMVCKGKEVKFSCNSRNAAKKQHQILVTDIIGGRVAGDEPVEDEEETDWR